MAITEDILDTHLLDLTVMDPTIHTHMDHTDIPQVLDTHHMGIHQKVTGEVLAWFETFWLIIFNKKLWKL